MAHQMNTNREGYWSDDSSIGVFRTNPPSRQREPSEMRGAKSARYSPRQENEKQHYQLWSPENRYVMIGFIGGVSITLVLFGIIYIQNISHQTELLETTRQNLVSISNQRYEELKECGATLRSSWNGNNEFVKESIKKENDANKDIVTLKQEVANLVKELTRCDEDINQLRGTWWGVYIREVIWSVSILFIALLIVIGIMSILKGPDKARALG